MSVRVGARVAPSTGVRKLRRPVATSSPSFNPLTDFSTDPVHGVWASDPLWVPPPDGGAVSSWRNGGSVGGDLVQATGSKQPTYRASTAAFNNQPTVQFDGTDDVLTPASSIADLASWEAVIVGQFLSTASLQSIIGGNGAANRVGVVTAAWYVRWGTAVSGSAADTDPHLLRVGTESDAMLVDEVSVLSNTIAIAMADWVIGGQDLTPGWPFNGHVALCLIFTSDPTAQPEWADFTTWVETTYGLTIA